LSPYPNGNLIFEDPNYKVVQIWPGLIVCKQVTVCPVIFEPPCTLFSFIAPTACIHNIHKHKIY
jgi:hypothetical protein